MTDLIDIDNKHKNRILINPQFTNNADNKILLKDIVIIYNNGNEWRVISLDIIQMYPIIHDKYYQIEKNNTQQIVPITVYICPYTLYSVVYFGEFISNNKVYNNNLTLIDKNNDDILLIPILNQFRSITNDTLIRQSIRKNEVRIMTLRNAITQYPDCQFIDSKHIHKIDPLVDINYITNDQILFNLKSYSNKYKAKQLIYVIEYISKKQNGYKYTILIPKNNSFDQTKNGFTNYFNKMISSIRNKGGIIYPCLWFVWNTVYPNTKIIQL